MLANVVEYLHWHKVTQEHCFDADWFVDLEATVRRVPEHGVVRPLGEQGCLMFRDKQVNQNDLRVNATHIAHIRDAMAHHDALDEVMPRPVTDVPALEEDEHGNGEYPGEGGELKWVNAIDPLSHSEGDSHSAADDKDGETHNRSDIATTLDLDGISTNGPSLHLCFVVFVLSRERV